MLDVVCLNECLIKVWCCSVKTEPKKPKPNSSVFVSVENRSIIDVWKTKIFNNRKTEPNSRFKPNAQA
jgi:hypothetical protein